MLVWRGLVSGLLVVVRARAWAWVWMLGWWADRETVQCALADRGQAVYSPFSAAARRRALPSRCGIPSEAAAAATAATACYAPAASVSAHPFPDPVPARSVHPRMRIAFPALVARDPDLRLSALLVSRSRSLASMRRGRHCVRLPRLAGWCSAHRRGSV